jgi:hypothetical protein
MRRYSRTPRPGYRLIFRWWFRHRITGKIVRSKTGRPFPLWVKG